MALATIGIEERDVATLDTIGEISIAFRVERMFKVERLANGEFALHEAPVPRPYIKDYDGIAGNTPVQWGELFDLSHWGLLTAQTAGRPIGSVLVAFDTPDLDLLEGRSDLAAIWDIRVKPEARRTGIGAKLMRAAEDWARAKGCTELRVETQNVNVGACRFYEKSGFRLQEADDAAYPDFPDETQLIWTKNLTQAGI